MLGFLGDQGAISDRHVYHHALDQAARSLFPSRSEARWSKLPAIEERRSGHVPGTWTGRREGREREWRKESTGLEEHIDDEEIVREEKQTCL